MSPGLCTPESPFDVLFSTSTMVDQTETQLRESCSPTSTTPPEKLKHHKQKYYKDNNRSLKERHPKFRRSPIFNDSRVQSPDQSTSAATSKMDNRFQPYHPLYPSEIEARLALPASSSLLFSYHQLLLSQHHQQQQQQQQQQQAEAEEGPLDMSIKKKQGPAPSPPPPYNFHSLFQPPTLGSAAPPPYYPIQPIPQRVAPPPSYEATRHMLQPPLATRRPDSPPKQDAKRERDRDSRPVREITIITADSSADPLLDEHFRRSLGANYENLYKKNGVTSTTKVKSPPLSPDSSSTSKAADSIVKAFKEEMAAEGCSVEDHFAKALGDTWTQLKAKNGNV